MAEGERSKEEEQPAEAVGGRWWETADWSGCPGRADTMEGSCCVAVLEAAAARDAPCPPQPRLKRDASSRVRGTGKSLVEIPSPWSRCGGATAGGDTREGGMGMAVDKGQRACVSSWLIGGFTAIWESSWEGAD